ncbi:hypothetical protein [Streptomonospora litoralis]|uniref:hypothetical protein n=1 Tax=Streptomonospora litoralis TaxID=2498135 RepID=UPI0013F15CFE|nr:hypothetical protein [Streptomonospora litoralis]
MPETAVVDGADGAATSGALGPRLCTVGAVLGADRGRVAAVEVAEGAMKRIRAAVR